jgi:hypothetical protein
MTLLRRIVRFCRTAAECLSAEYGVINHEKSDVYSRLSEEHPLSQPNPNRSRRALPSMPVAPLHAGDSSDPGL